MVIIVWACSPISFKHMSSWYPISEPHLITLNILFSATYYMELHNAIYVYY